MTLVTRPSMTDSPDGSSGGTSVDKALMDAVLDTVDDQCHSTTNPTIKPKTITDEVKAARGNKASLAARLLVAMDLDGNPTASADLAALQTEVQNARGGEVNLDTRLDLVDALLAGAKGSLSTIDARLDRTMDADGYINSPYSKTLKHTVGTGSNTGPAPARINASTASANNGTTVETDLHSFTLTGGSLDEDGDELVYRASGSCANTASTKDLKFKFGAAVVTVFSGAFGSPGAVVYWDVEIRVIRLSATTQRIVTRFSYQSTGNAIHQFIGEVSGTETLTGAVTVKMTGQSSASSNDVTQTYSRASVN